MPTVNPVPLPAAPRTHTRLGPRHEPRPSLCRHPRAPGRGAVCFLVPFTLRPPTPGVCQSPTISRACSMGTPAVTSDPIARDNTPTSACLGNANARSGCPIASPTCSAMIAPSAGSVVSRTPAPLHEMPPREIVRRRALDGGSVQVSREARNRIADFGSQTSAPRRGRGRARLCASGPRSARPGARPGPRACS